MAKKTFKEYSEYYFKVVENFTSDGKDMVLDGTYSEAVYVRHELHRFFKAISVAAPEDPYAARLFNITRDITLMIDPPHTAREASAKLYVKMNPLAKMMMQSSPPKEPEQ